MSRWKAGFEKKKIKTLFQQEMIQEYRTIQPHLPDKCQTILDIGCGVAGIDALLFYHYQDPEMQIFLLDKTRIDKKPYHGFSQRATFYNSLPVARGLLTANGIPINQIHLLEANEANEIPIPGPIDLIISTFSWGFHYPVSAYLDQVYGLLSEHGRLMIDIRKTTNGREMMDKKFAQTQVISTGESHHRILAQK